MNTRALTLAVFAIATAMLTTVVLVPVGAKDKLISQKELKNLIANGQTKAEHERIAQHFEAEAAQWEAQAYTHEELDSTTGEIPIRRRGGIPGVRGRSNIATPSQKTSGRPPKRAVNWRQITETWRSSQSEHRVFDVRPRLSFQF